MSKENNEKVKEYSLGTHPCSFTIKVNKGDVYGLSWCERILDENPFSVELKGEKHFSIHRGKTFGNHVE